MKIAVCFKLIPDYEQLPFGACKEGSILRPLSNILDTKYIGKVFAFFDEASLETALRIKDINKDTVLEAISLGKEDRLYTQSLYATGYDRVCYLDANSDFDSKNTALGLYSYIKDQNFDLILMGESAGPMDSGSVPYHLSNLLKCPIVNKISDIELKDNDLILTRETSEAIEEYRIDPSNTQAPLIAVMSDAKHPYLRMASYLDREKIKDIKADHTNAQSGKRNIRLEPARQNNRGANPIDKKQLLALLQKGGGML